MPVQISGKPRNFQPKSSPSATSKVIRLKSAEHNLKELRAYLVKNFTLATWQDTYGRLKKAIRLLKDHPCAGSVPEEFERLNLSQYRQVVSGLNRIIYEVRQDMLYIYIIVDGRRILQALLTRRLSGKGDVFRGLYRGWRPPKGCRAATESHPF